MEVIRWRDLEAQGRQLSYAEKDLTLSKQRSLRLGLVKVEKTTIKRAVRIRKKRQRAWANENTKRSWTLQTISDHVSKTGEYKRKKLN